MKHLKQFAVTAACIAALITPAQAKYALLMKSVPFWIEAPLVTTKLSLFWETLALYGLQTIEKSMAEPLEKYEAGIWKSIRSSSATITWPDGDYETRDIDTERFYDYDPFTKIAKWWWKNTYTVIRRDGTRNVEISYSQVPPEIVEFNQEDVHYKRNVLAGSHSSDFSFDSFQDLTGYCIRRGSGAWGRPVTAWFTGWDCLPLWRNDILYHSPVSPWEDTHHCFIGPSSLGTSSLALFKLKRQLHTPGIAEVSNIFIVTTWFRPPWTWD
jgi:hypothetical protein